MFKSLRNYRSRWLGADAVAGSTVWAILVPEALAYATIAGVSPVVGLYAAPGALILYAASGSSRELVVGPMAATAALSAAVVGDVVAGSGDAFAQATAALAISVGLAALVAGLLRLGFLASFISEPVLKGFIIGLALTILIGQIPKLFGIDAGEGDFFEKAWDFLAGIGSTDGLTLMVGTASLALVLGLRRLAPGVPGALVAVFLAIAAVELFDLGDHIAIVGPIASGLPDLALPGVGLDQFGALAAGAVGVMLVGFSEGIGAAKTFERGGEGEIDANRELIGLGAANLGAGLSSGMVVNGSLSKTAVNASAGARSQLAGLIAALLTVLTLLLFTGIFESLPEATLAAVVISALIELVDFPALRDLYRVFSGPLGRIYGLAARADFLAAVAAMLGVMIFDTLPGLFIGIGLSLLLLVYRASRPNVAVLGRVPEDGRWEDVARHPAASPERGVVVLRPESGLFFANSDFVGSRVLAAARHEDVRLVVIDAETVPFLDVTAARVLEGIADQLAPDGIQLVLARGVGQVRDVIGATGATRGDETRDLGIATTVEEAVRTRLQS